MLVVSFLLPVESGFAFGVPAKKSQPETNKIIRRSENDGKHRCILLDIIKYYSWINGKMVLNGRNETCLRGKKLPLWNHLPAI